MTDRESTVGTHDSATIDDDSFFPPVVERDYRPRRTGIRRPITFVKERSPEQVDSQQPSSIGSSYLSLVLRKTDDVLKQDSNLICPVCKLPLSSDVKDAKGSRAHDTSIVHQICQEHKHTPSAIDRSRMGFKYINSQGWDPDERRGLGKGGDGIRFPVLPKEKNDKLGIGARLKPKKPEAEQVAKQKPLNAKQVRKQEAENRQKKQKLERLFYSNGELEKYLGEEL